MCVGTFLVWKQLGRFVSNRDLQTGPPHLGEVDRLFQFCPTKVLSDPERRSLSQSKWLSKKECHRAPGIWCNLTFPKAIAITTSFRSGWYAFVGNGSLFCCYHVVVVTVL